MRSLNSLLNGISKQLHEAGARSKLKEYQKIPLQKSCNSLQIYFAKLFCFSKIHNLKETGSWARNLNFGTERTVNLHSLFSSLSLEASRKEEKFCSPSHLLLLTVIDIYHLESCN